MKLITVWEGNKNAGDTVHRHSHGFYELVYYRTGRGITHIGGAAYAIAPNTFAVIPKGVEHDEFHEEKGRLICLGVSEEDPIPPGVYRDREGAVAGVLKVLLREAAEQQSGYREMITAKLLELKTVVCRLCASGGGGTKDFTFVVNYIRENYHERILLSDLARQLHLSYDYFQHRFHQITGRSPRQFLQQRRLTVARELLEQGALNCTEIAYRCGFSDAAQFSRLFKKAYGIAPLQYRRSVVGK